MSLINQMLRDLEKRRSQDGNGEGFSAGTLHRYSVASKNRFPLLLVFSLLSLLLAAAVLYLLWERNSNTTIVINNTETATPVTSRSTTANKQLAVSKVMDEPAKEIPRLTSPASKVQQAQQQFEQVSTSDRPAIKQPVVNTRINSVSPDPVPASDRRQSITVHGEGFTRDTRLTVSWDKGSKTLSSSQLKLVSDKQLIMSIVVGSRDNTWTLQASDPEYGDSAQFDFDVINEKQLAVERVTKVARPLAAKQQAELLYQQGYQLLSRGQSQQGENKLLEAIGLYAGHVKAREVLAGMYIKSGRVVEASELLEQGLLVYPGNILFTRLQAHLLLEQGQFSQAITLLEKNRPAINSEPEYYALLAAAYQRDRQYEKAVSTYQSLLKVNPVAGQWWIGLGISLEALGRKVEARSAYEKARATGRLPAELARYVNQRLSALP